MAELWRSTLVSLVCNWLIQFEKWLCSLPICLSCTGNQGNCFACFPWLLTRSLAVCFDWILLIFRCSSTWPMTKILLWTFLVRCYWYWTDRVLHRSLWWENRRFLDFQCTALRIHLGRSNWHQASARCSEGFPSHLKILESPCIRWCWSPSKSQLKSLALPLLVLGLRLSNLAFYGQRLVSLPHRNAAYRSLQTSLSTDPYGNSLFLCFQTWNWIIFHVKDPSFSSACLIPISAKTSARLIAACWTY